VDSQIKPFLETIDQLHEDIYKAIEPLSDEEINWKHPHLINSVGILLRHVAGSERYWIIEVVGGTPIHRKRDEEFGKERLQKALLVANLRAAQKEVKAAIEPLAPDQLLEEVEQRYRDLPRRLSKSWCILHSIQHTAYHLGQIQLFAKMATKGAAAPMPPGR
jgi:uncharacterized damage-inducible protein DinB